MSPQNTNITSTLGAAATVLFLFAETPVHAGSGSEEAALDLPIQRSPQTGWPILADGTVRGGLRNRVKELGGGVKAKELFGHEDKVKSDDDQPPDPAATPHAGYFSTPDAEILLFPVASARGMTAWVTCPAALEYFRRKLEIFRMRLSPTAQQVVADLAKACIGLSSLGQNTALVPSDSAIAWDGSPKKLILETDSHAVGDTAVDALAGWLATHAVPLGQYWRDRVRTHFALISDEAFSHYTRRKTDIRTRIRISKGRVEQGGLWTEENLPVDTVLYGVLAVPDGGQCERLREFEEIIGLSDKPVVQLGGDQNLGRGMLRLCRLGGAQS